jgi:chaperonin GroES
MRRTKAPDGQMSLDIEDNRAYSAGNAEGWSVHDFDPGFPVSESAADCVQAVADEDTDPPLPDEPLAQLRRIACMSNAMDAFSSDAMQALGERALAEYNLDRDSRAGWEAAARASLKALLPAAEAKSYPFENAANIKYPLLTTACLQFAARAYPAIVSGERIVKALVPGAVSDEEARCRADRVETHMSYQLRQLMCEWEEDTDTLLHQLPAVGCAFRKVYWSREQMRPVSQMVSALDLVVNQNAVSLETVPRITQRFELYPHEIDERARAGTFAPVALELHADGSERDASGFAHNRGLGDDSLAPHVFLEQHRNDDLDGDGLGEPWIVTVHEATGQVVRLAANFDLDQVVLDASGTIVRLPRFEYFVKYSFLPDPRGGFYDIGFGELLKPLTECIDSTINQMLDAGHLQNAGGGFIGSGLNLKKSQMRFSPGTYHTVNAPGGVIRDAIVTVPHPGPSAVSQNLLNMLIASAKQITAVQDVLTGDMPRAQAVATTLAQIEQGLKVFTAIYKRIYRALTQEYRLLYALNGRYPDECEYLSILNWKPQVGCMPPSMAADYAARGCRLTPVADPAIVTDMQRLAKAQFLMELSAHPVLGSALDRGRVTRWVLDAANFDHPHGLMTAGST